MFMLKTKIKRAAKKESARYGGQVANNANMWERMPFIVTCLKQCDAIPEKISADKKTKKIFFNIKEIQADYCRIIQECKEKFETTDDAIKRKEQEIADIEIQLQIRNNQIQDYNDDKPLNAAENIEQIKEIAEKLSNKFRLLDAEKQELHSKKEAIRKTKKNQLDEKYKELMKYYTDFSNRNIAMTSKAEQQIKVIENYAVLYTDYFWNYFLKRLIKERKKNKNMRKIDLPFKPEMNTAKFRLKTDLFADEKEEINSFNNEYKIEYTIRVRRNINA